MTSAATPKRPALIAHRGYAQHFPENSIIGIEGAIQAGAQFVEVDVQMTADGVPVLLHDASLQRTAGIDQLVTDVPLDQVRTLDLNEPGRFRHTFPEVRIPTLAELVTLLKQSTVITTFVEVKPASLQQFGVTAVMNKVIDELRPDPTKFAIISFDQRAVECARGHGLRVGLVLDAHRHEQQGTVARLCPDYVFCDHRILADEPAGIWLGPWQWAVYEVGDVELARRIAGLGADFIETMAIGELLRVDPFGGACPVV